MTSDLAIKINIGFNDSRNTPATDLIKAWKSILMQFTILLSIMTKVLKGMENAKEQSESSGYFKKNWGVSQQSKGVWR